MQWFNEQLYAPQGKSKRDERTKNVFATLAATLEGRAYSLWPKQPTA